MNFNVTPGWQAIGLTLIVLLAVGLINDKTRAVAVWGAVFIALVLVLVKMGRGSVGLTAGQSTPAPTPYSGTKGTFA